VSLCVFRCAASFDDSAIIIITASTFFVLQLHQQIQLQFAAAVTSTGASTGTSASLLKFELQFLFQL
jgi:hypothetical protein